MHFGLWLRPEPEMPVPLMFTARTVAISAKYSQWPVSQFAVASCYCAPGSGCDRGDGARGCRKLLLQLTPVLMRLT